MPKLAPLCVIAILALACAPTVPMPGQTTTPAPPDAGVRKIPDAGTDSAASAAGADRPAAEPARDAAARDTAPGRAPDAGPDAVSDAPSDVPSDRLGSSPIDGRPDAADAGPPLRAPAAGDIVIVEVLVDPAGNDLGREWLEIQSAVDEELDLGGLHLADGATDVALDGGRLAARGLLVLGQSADPTHNGGATVDRAYGTRLQLNNDADGITICLGPCAGGVALDAFAWDGTLGPPYQGRSVVIDRAARTICPASTPFGAEGSFGSPGAPNAPCPPVDAGGADAGNADSP